MHIPLISVKEHQCTKIIMENENAIPHQSGERSKKSWIQFGKNKMDCILTAHSQHITLQNKWISKIPR